MGDNTERWRTVDFRPAPAGWCIIHLASEYWPSPDGFHAVAAAGWLIQESDEDENRRVIVGEVNEFGEVNEVLFLDNTSAWYVLGPGDPPPTTDDATRERVERDERWKLECQRRRVAKGLDRPPSTVDYVLGPSHPPLAADDGVCPQKGPALDR